jgi:hypothetical protein
MGQDHMPGPVHRRTPAGRHERRSTELGKQRWSPHRREDGKLFPEMQMCGQPAAIPADPMAGGASLRGWRRAWETWSPRTSGRQETYVDHLDGSCDVGITVETSVRSVKIVRETNAERQRDFMRLTLVPNVDGFDQLAPGGWHTLRSEVGTRGAF